MTGGGEVFAWARLLRENGGRRPTTSFISYAIGTFGTRSIIQLAYHLRGVLPDGRSRLPRFTITGAATENKVHVYRANYSSSLKASDRTRLGYASPSNSAVIRQLVGVERAIVSPEPGTTRDAVDTLLRRGDKVYRFIDTAGIRRKGKTKLVAEKLSVVMARKNLERAQVALLVVDAEQGVTSGDATIASYTQQSGRSVIVVMNKWDLALEAAGKKAAREAKGDKTRLDPGRLLYEYERIVRARLKFLDYAPVVFLSALTSERVGKLFGLIDQVAEARRRPSCCSPTSPGGCTSATSASWKTSSATNLISPAHRFASSNG